MQVETLKSLYITFKERQLFVRHIHTKSIEPLLENLSTNFKLESIAKSVSGENIYAVKIVKERKKYCCGLKCMVTNLQRPKVYLMFLIF